MRNTVYSARKEILGENHLDTLTALADLADSYSYLEDYNKANELQNVVYIARIEIQGNQHPETLKALSSLVHTDLILSENNEID